MDALDTRPYKLDLLYPVTVYGRIPDMARQIPIRLPVYKRPDIRSNRKLGQKQTEARNCILPKNANVQQFKVVDTKNKV